MRLQAFDIMLLKEEVTRHLSPRDLAQCVLVSRQWRAWFTSILWRSPYFRSGLGAGDLAILVRYQEYIENIANLDVAKKVIAVKGIKISPPNLQSIKFSFTKTEGPIFMESALKLISTTPTLKSISFTIWNYHDQYHRILIPALKSHPQLQEFHLSCWSSIQPISVSQIIEASSQFETVSLSLGGSGDAYSLIGQDIIKVETAVQNCFEKMQNTKIRDLSIQMSLENEAVQVISLLLRRCPLLENLSLIKLHLGNSLTGITQVFRDGGCPGLKHLTLKNFYRLKHSDQDLAELLGSIGGDDAIRDLYSKPGLESISLDAGVDCRYLCTLALTQYHSETLTRLETSQFVLLNLEEFVELTNGLPKLQSITANIRLATKMRNDEDTNILFETQWNCLMLRELDIKMNFARKFKYIQEHNWEGSVEARATSYVMSQIGRLQCLETLRLDSDMQILVPMRGPGYLTRLKGLKKLHVLHLKRWVDGSMGVEEAEWMIRNWPCLDHVSIGHYKSPRNPYISQSINMPFVSRLLVRRPLIKID